ncbi:hypothetical protein HHI36_001762 [Cryptolaemus montrouzieri]|uniref:Uncharacterized protein n=1 Tax=Cryptolaemus montrouzieri TaxID=559131 RepID=A0ABD2P9C0_9CUCU
MTELKSHSIFSRLRKMVIQNPKLSHIETVKPKLEKVLPSKTNLGRKVEYGSLVLNILANSVKALIASIAIYFTIDMGCWKKTYMEPINTHYENPIRSEVAEDDLKSLSTSRY